MKFIYFFLFFALALVPYNTFGQSKVFKTLEEVDIHPAFPGCDDLSFGFCSAIRVTSFIQEKVSEEIINTLGPDGTPVSLKLILDDTGKVKRVLAHGENESLNAEVVRVAKDLPQFSPAFLKGKEVNIVLEVPLLLKPKEIFDSRPIAKKCTNKNNPEKCTAFFVQDFVQKEFQEPELDIEEGIVTATVNFWIDESGNISDFEAFGPEEEFNKACIEALKKLPAFIPATRDGKNIKFMTTFRTMKVYRK